MTNAAVPAGKFFAFDYLQFWVGNAKQAASYYCARYGFVPMGYRGLETGEKQVCTHLIRQNDIIFAFSSPLQPNNKEMSEHMALHGDGVKDVAFRVSDARAIFAAAVANGATAVQAPHELSDEHGTVVLSSVKTYGDTIHTFVDRTNYKGDFLPGFRIYSAEESTKLDPLAAFLGSSLLGKVDHCVGNQPWHEMIPIAEWYEQKLGFHRFWSVDDSIIHTEYSALKSIVVTDRDENVKMPINEPAKGKKKSQIQEYVEFYGGSGVQHIALSTSDIIESVKRLRQRGVEFLTIPTSYYDNLRKRLAVSSVKVKEDLDTIQRLHILVDFDDKGYLLQIFTKPVEDRPTLFFEVIQRFNNEGFGAGNFKALFESLEMEQAKRGTLTDFDASEMERKK